MKVELNELREKLGSGYDEDIDLLLFCANTNGWRLVQVDTRTYMLGFKLTDRRLPRINVYLTKSTFVTQLEHPKQGKSQLFRRNVRQEDYDRIFTNPRTHTGKGYHRRTERK